MSNEELILKNLVTNEEYLRKVSPFLFPDYFSESYEKIVYNLITEYYEKYNTAPSVEALKINLQNSKGISEHDFTKSVQVIDSFSGDYSLPNIKWLLETTEKFCKDKAILNAIMSSINIIDGNDKQFSVDHIPELLSKALAISFEQDIGHDWFDNANKRYEFYHMVEKRIPFEIDILNKITNGGLPTKSLTVLVAGTGCHAKNTPILMRDGTIKNIQDISIGDKLIDETGNETIVLDTVNGVDNMFEISMTTTNEKFVVNGEHILSLVKTGTNNIINISVYDYIKKSNKFKHLHKMFHNKNILEFEKNTDVSIDPYFVGLYLGDGSVGSIGITTMDKEIEEYCYNIADFYGMKIRKEIKPDNKASTYNFVGIISNGFGKNRNILEKEFENYGLVFGSVSNITKCGDKFIPNEYKTSSSENRLKLLAGLIDSDGYLSKTHYEICLKSKKLSEDILFVARSLGFYCSQGIKLVNNVPYYRTRICFTKHSPTSIPCKLERKQFTYKNTCNKDLLNSSFNVKHIGVDEYYGIKVSGSSLYTMGNFIVTHNCGKSGVMCDWAAANARNGYNVLYVSLEMAEERIGERLDANMLQSSFNELRSLDKDTYLTKMAKLRKKHQGNLILKEYTSGGAHAGHIVNLIEDLRSKKNFVPDILYIDYLGIMASARFKANANVNSYQYLKAISEEVRAIGQRFDIPVVTAVQTNRSGTNNSDVEMDNIADSFGINYTADYIYYLYASDEMKALNQLLFKKLKDRYGDLEYYKRFLVGFDRSKMRCYNLEQPTGNIHMPDVKTDLDNEKPSFSNFSNWS